MTTKKIIGCILLAIVAIGILGLLVAEGGPNVLSAFLLSLFLASCLAIGLGLLTDEP